MEPEAIAWARRRPNREGVRRRETEGGFGGEDGAQRECRCGRRQALPWNIAKGNTRRSGHLAYAAWHPLGTVIEHLPRTSSRHVRGKIGGESSGQLLFVLARSSAAL